MHERSFAVPANKKPQASEKRKSARRSIKNMTRDDSCIKGALLVRCIHVSMVLKEQEDSGMMSTLCCPYERSFAVPAQNVMGER
jgi:hypothetical protein